MLSFQVCYLLMYNPFEEPLMQKLEVYNELTMIFLIYCIISFSPMNLMLAESEFSLAVIFLCFLLGNIGVHLYFLVKDSVL